MSEKKIYLTSAEIASLWTGYMNDSMSKRILGFMLKHIEDPDIKPAIQSAHDISSKHLIQLHCMIKQWKSPLQKELMPDILTT